jgi:hypothetical protein
MFNMLNEIGQTQLAFVAAQKFVAIFGSQTG